MTFAPFDIDSRLAMAAEMRQQAARRLAVATSFFDSTLSPPLHELSREATHDPAVVQLSAVAKFGTTFGHPYCAANEVICSRLAVAAGLPSPQVVAVRSSDGHVGTASLTVSDLEVVTAELLVCSHPRLAAAIAAFDLWVLEPDRGYNVHRAGDRFVLLDHGMALFGAEGPARLERCVRDWPVYPGSLVPLCDREHLRAGACAVRGVPDFAVEAAVRDAHILCGLGPDAAAVAVRFLLDRKRRISEHV